MRAALSHRILRLTSSESSGSVHKRVQLIGELAQLWMRILAAPNDTMVSNLFDHLRRGPARPVLP